MSILTGSKYGSLSSTEYLQPSSDSIFLTFGFGAAFYCAFNIFPVHGGFQSLLLNPE